MKQFIIIDAAGLVVRSGVVSTDGDVSAQVLQPGHSLVAGVTARPRLDRWTGAAVEALPVAAPTLAKLKEQALDRLASRRWQAENGGVIVAGIRVATDDRSKLLIADAGRRAEADSSFTTKWKSRDGWVTLNATALIGLRNAVFAHVAACFAREAELADAVAAADTAAGLVALGPTLARFWPE